ncbi:MAG: hypothetical protein V7L23_08000 [Nostoc sp.]|uniref:hypothetical protein n=1 Tax=Nostoc sp. TaxID=1180 RepID=UPI002FEF8606
MGTTDAEANPRTKKEKLEFDSISRSSSATRGEIAFARTEQKRIHRESSSRPSILRPGEKDTKKMLDRLISEYEDQIAVKESEIAEIKTRVKDLNSLKDELNSQDENCE